jgi:NAD(P)-dependent dehydrogenase (short-subunit alcohol dehydrogenase family)
MRFDDRVVLVTGAGGPMGKAIAAKFAGHGAALVMTDISGNRLRQGVDEIHGDYPDCETVAVRANAIMAEEIRAVAETALRHFGKVDVLVNVVGGIRSNQLYTPFLDLTERQWDDTLALNLKGGFHLVQKLAPGMLERQYGKIVNISSIAFAGEPGQCDYAAAKAAVASMTRTLAAEFAPHINVNCVAPGLIRTSVTKRIDPRDIDRLTGASLIKRLGEADEIADAVCFLSSDEASFVTGEILAVSGGNHPGL